MKNSMNDLMCFSDNRNSVEIAFRDYMNQYFTEVKKKDGYPYDKTISFADKEAKINNAMKKEISRLANVDFSGDTISKEMWGTHPLLKWASFAVANSLIDMILPSVLDNSIGRYTERRNIANGDSAMFTVEPNDLFYVSKVGRDQRTVEFQKQFQGNVSVVPEARGISVSVNFYKVLCGMESLAKFVMKAILSIESQITREVYTAFDKAMSELPTTPEDSKLNITGWDDAEAIRAAQTVTAFNQSPAIFMGTKLSLRHILPKDANYRYFLEDDYVQLGYVRNAFGYDTVEMPQVADWKNPYKTFLNDKKIYVISPASQKPVKLVLEGATRTNTMAAQDSANLTESTTITISYGIVVATNAIAAVITL